MIKILLDNEMSDYISKYLNCNKEIETIYLDSSSMNIKQELAYFIKELLTKRTFSTTKYPYIYDENSKILGIGKYDNYLDSTSMNDELEKILELSKTDIPMLCMIDPRLLGKNENEE